MNRYALKPAMVTGALVAIAAFGYVVFSASSTPSASANNPNAGLEYRLTVPGCSSAGDAKANCVLIQGLTFVASVYLDSIAGIGNGSYDGLTVTIAYTGLGSKDNPDVVWPGCFFEAPSTGPGFTSSGCAGGISAPPSTFTGLVFTNSFNCTADGTLSLAHGVADTLVIDGKGKTNVEAGPDVLNIDCAPDSDADGDGCLTSRELSGNVMTGGLRNPNNFWDFADMPQANTVPARDKRILVDDILRVVQRYNADDAGGTAPINRYSDPLSPPPKTGYHPAFDRTYVGPQDWDLTGPGIGRIRIDDVLNVVKQYGHSCA